MAVAVPRYTLDDLDSFPDDGNRYELVDGVLLVTPAPMPPHQMVLDRLLSRLYLHLGEAPKARIFIPGSVEVAPRLHMEPDILVVPVTEPTAGRWTDVRVWWLAVEISGRGSRVYDRDHKRPAYLAVGVREVWRADLRQRCVFIATPTVPDECRVDDRLVWRVPELPLPLVVEVGDLFDGVTGDD